MLWCFDHHVCLCRCFVILYDILLSLWCFVICACLPWCFVIRALYLMFYHPSWYFAIMPMSHHICHAMMFCHLCHLCIFVIDVSSSSPCLSVHLWVDVSSSCMFVILLWFSISLLGVMFCHQCLDVLSSFPCLYVHLCADVSSSCLLVILLWFSISLKGVMFCHQCLDVSSSLPWYFVIYEPMFRHRACLLSYFDFRYHC